MWRGRGKWEGTRSWEDQCGGLHHSVNAVNSELLRCNFRGQLERLCHALQQAAICRLKLLRQVWAERSGRALERKHVPHAAATERRGGCEWRSRVCQALALEREDTKGEME
jgi:hypothetical protein